MADKRRAKTSPRAARTPAAPPRPPLARRRNLVLCLALALAALAAYANHFHNGFHFDDSHTILYNLSIRDLRNVPRFFADGSLFSISPVNNTYRPVTSVSLAVDYWLGRGLKPFYFHLSTFVWFLVQLVLMFFLFRRLMNAADDHPSNTWTALLATALYGLHPANAETVNYIIQRGDLYDTLGVVASLLMFIAWPARRKYGFYLLPAVAAYFSKAPALIFPFILLAYVSLFETAGRLRAVWPAFAVTAAAAVFTARMTPSTFSAGAVSASLYRLTQPWVALHYFRSFFLPTRLCADAAWVEVSSAFSAEALAGYLFVAALLAAAFYTSRRREMRPIAFGILWFFLALLPTSLVPLADVMNDHRMFFPFVGLALAVFWTLRLVLFRMTARLTANLVWLRGALAVAMLALLAAAVGTHVRNRVWHTEASLWRDVVLKSPQNPRGLMGYGHALNDLGDYAQALSYLERADNMTPNSTAIEINLGVACAGLHRDAEVERHFQRAEALDPAIDESYMQYGRWLQDKGRLAESQEQFEAALRLNPGFMPVRELLMRVYSGERNWRAIDALVDSTLQLVPDNAVARGFQAGRAARPESAAAGSPGAPGVSQAGSPDALLNLSIELCKAGKYPECLTAARQALELRPAWAEAYNNMAAAFLYMKRWDEGILAARQALALKPDYVSAQRNLSWAMSHKDDAPSGGR